MNNKQRTNGFTLIELLVAVGILAIVLSFAGVIFRVCINSHRTAIANAEIMQKLRAVTDQLNADFKGLRKDAPLFIWFQQDPNNPDQRYDQIMFFADGDFQSIQLYDYNGNVGFLVPAPTGASIRGNVARIYYGQAYSRDSRDDMMRYPFNLPEIDRALTRNQHILTDEPGIIDWFANFNVVEVVYDKYPNNDFYEHDRLSLSEWKMVDRAAYETLIIPACFDVRPQIDIHDPNTFHKLMSEGLGSFAVQLGYWDPGPDLVVNSVDDYYGWYPSYDSDGDPATIDSHFLSMGPMSHMFGVYFNTPELPDELNPIESWYRIEDGNVQYSAVPDIKTFAQEFYPDALKFTFKLYDSKAIIKEGRTFTHIVYLD